MLKGFYGETSKSPAPAASQLFNTCLFPFYISHSPRLQVALNETFQFPGLRAVSTNKQKSKALPFPTQNCA